MADDTNENRSDHGVLFATTTSSDVVMDDDANDGKKNQNEKVLRAEFTIKGADRKRPFEVHARVRSLVEAIIQTDRNITFKIKDGDSTFNTLETFPTEEKFKRFFPITGVKSEYQAPQKVVVEINIQSPTVIDFYKTKEGPFSKYLFQEKIWIVEHNFETLEVTEIGWIQEISTVLALQPEVENLIRMRIREHENTVPGGSTESINPTPTFDIKPRNIQGSKIEGTNKRRECRGYEVSCEAIHAETLRAKLMDSQAFDNHDPREGVYIDHGLRTSSLPEDTGLYDDNIHSQNEYLDKVKKIEIFGVDRKAMNTKIDELQNVSLLDHLLNHGTHCEADATSTPTISSIEPTKETDTAGKWWILYRSDKETAVKTALGKVIPLLHNEEPELFPDISIGGNRKAGAEAYANTLRDLTKVSPNSKNIDQPKRTHANGNRNRNRNHQRSLVTIAYDEKQYPELSTPTIEPSSHSPSTPLTKPNNTNATAVDSHRKDTYASRTTANSSTKSNGKTNNKATKNVTGKHRRDEAATLEHHSSDGDDVLQQRIAAQEARMAKIESELLQQGATVKRMELSSSAEIKALGVLIADLTSQIAALTTFVRPNPKLSNETTVNTVRDFPSKRRPVSSPSPNGAAKPQTKRASRPEPRQLYDEEGDDLALDAWAFEDEGDMLTDAMDATFNQSRCNSPSLETEITMEGSKTGAITTQSGSYES
jgi:hypothetical protein